MAFLGRFFSIFWALFWIFIKHRILILQLVRSVSNRYFSVQWVNLTSSLFSSSLFINRPLIFVHSTHPCLSIRPPWVGLGDENSFQDELYHTINWCMRLKQCCQVEESSISNPYSGQVKPIYILVVVFWLVMWSFDNLDLRQFDSSRLTDWLTVFMNF